jgi:hypothetical protein
MASTELVIAEPGVYDGVPAEVYHADPVPGGSLSSTGARLLMPPNCPAKYRWYADNPQPPTRIFDFGHAAHRYVLGAGPDVVVVNADSWRTKAARAVKDQAHEAGEVPLLEAEHDRVLEMVAAVRRHPIAGPLFAAEAGAAEQTLVWRDPETGVWCRALYDWMRHRGEGRRLIVADYKTAASADPKAVAKAMNDHGYERQGDWYLAGARVLGLTGDLDPVFVLVVQEKEPPYLITVAQPNGFALRYAALANRKAIAVYRECAATGVWPGYADGVIDLPLPPYAEIQYQTAFERGDFDVENR